MSPVAVGNGLETTYIDDLRSTVEEEAAQQASPCYISFNWMFIINRLPIQNKL